MPQSAPLGLGMGMPAMRTPHPASSTIPPPEYPFSNPSMGSGSQQPRPPSSAHHQIQQQQRAPLQMGLPQHLQQNSHPAPLDRLPPGSQISHLAQPPPLSQASQPQILPTTRGPLPVGSGPQLQSKAGSQATHDTNRPPSRSIHGSVPSTPVPTSYSPTPRQHPSPAPVFQHPLQLSTSGQMSDPAQQHLTNPLSSSLFAQDSASIHSNGFVPTPAQQLQGQIVGMPRGHSSPHILPHSGNPSLDSQQSPEEFRFSQSNSSRSPLLHVQQPPIAQNAIDPRHRLPQYPPSSSGHQPSNTQPIARAQHTGSLGQSSATPGGFAIGEDSSDSLQSYSPFTNSLLSGRGSLCLFRFACSLDASPHDAKRIAFWDQLIRRFFSNDGDMTITLCSDRDLKPLRFGSKYIPRFFQVTSLCGVTGMRMAFEGLSETPVPEDGQRVVVQCQLAWSFHYDSGYTITLHGPLSAEIQGDVQASPGHSTDWQIKSFNFFSKRRERQINLDAIKGHRQEASGGTARDGDNHPPGLIIGNAYLPPDPVNDFGVPEWLLRCLEFAEVCEVMEELVAFAIETNGSAKDALRQFTSNIRNDHPHIYEGARHLRAASFHQAPPSFTLQNQTPTLQATEATVASALSPSKTAAPAAPATPSTPVTEGKAARQSNPQTAPAPRTTAAKRKAQDTPTDSGTAGKRTSRPRKQKAG